MALDETQGTELVFLGAGAAKVSLQEQCAENGLGDRVHFVDHQPLNVAMAAMAESDLAVVSLAPGLIDSAYPSKTVMYLEMGCRILAIVENQSELAQLIVTENLGAVAEPGAVRAIASAIAGERDRTSGPDDETRSREIAAALFSAESVLPVWPRIIEGVQA
jgi:glycosyltransferase involved in cell wall biosynthesis